MILYMLPEQNNALCFNAIISFQHDFHFTIIDGHIAKQRPGSPSVLTTLNDLPKNVHLLTFKTPGWNFTDSSTDANKGRTIYF